MAARLLLDRIEGSILDTGNDYTRCIRAAVVYDIDTNLDGSADALVLIRALATQGMPQRGDPHPAIANCNVARHIVRGLANNQAKVEIVYETPQHGAALPPKGTFLLTETTGVQSEPTFFDSDGNPLSLEYQPNFRGTTYKFTVTMNRLVPIRTLKLTGIVDGLTPTQLNLARSAVHTVNDTDWNGLKTGYWLCAGSGCETDDLGKTFRLEATFSSRVYRDWREFQIFRDANGDVPKDVADNAKVIAACVKKAYRYGIDTSVNGFIGCGFYKPLSFRTTFGV